MTSFPTPPTLRLQLFSLPLNPLSPPHLRRHHRRPPTSASLSAPSTSFPYSFPHQFRHPPTPEPDNNDDDVDDDRAIGDCLVFEDGAFEGLADPFPRPSPSPDRPRRGRRPPPAAAVIPETLVPEKWKDVVEKLNLTKKEKRKIAQQIKFGPRLDQRKPVPIPDAQEYHAYKEMKMAQLNPTVLDEPPLLSDEDEVLEEEMREPPVRGRAAPRNPRVRLDGETMEDIAEFFNSEAYTPGETDDDKEPQVRRKLFSKEEKVLLNKRIPDIEAATSNKWMPIHTLAASGEFHLLDMLLKHNVDVNAIDKDGFSAIHRAIIGKKQAIINYLLRNSVNPFVRDKEGATLIHYAVQSASSQTIKILLLYNVDINLADDDGWTPLHLAVQTQRTDIVRLLLIKGADRTLKNQDGLTPLDLCLYSGHGMRTYELIKLLKGLPNPKSHP